MRPASGKVAVRVRPGRAVPVDGVLRMAGERVELPADDAKALIASAFVESLDEPLDPDAVARRELERTLIESQAANAGIDERRRRGLADAATRQEQREVNLTRRHENALAHHVESAAELSIGGGEE